MLNFYFNNKLSFTIENGENKDNIIKKLKDKIGLEEHDFYLLCNGKICNFNDELSSTIHVVPRFIGGKGGFGSMLRAIGAQIEKTTNREACRDLSGRRLRDINEEKRLKNWIDQQAEREQEAADKKQRKLERLCQKPKHEFKDETYDKERSDLPERLEDAVTQGLAASTSNSGKRKAETDDKKKKKKKLWLDDDLADLSSSDDESSSENEEKDGGNIVEKEEEERNENIVKAEEETKSEGGSNKEFEIKEMSNEGDEKKNENCNDSCKKNEVENNVKK